MSVFKFFDKSVCYEGGKAFLARLDLAIADTDELLRSLYQLLWFPGCFGLNWNTRSDCLRNLDWISQNKVRIVNESIPDIPDSDLRIYT
jgi:hypothetical protein